MRGEETWRRQKHARPVRAGKLSLAPFAKGGGKWMSAVFSIPNGKNAHNAAGWDESLAELVEALA